MKSVVPSATTGTTTLGRLLDVEQIKRTLAFLAGYRPAVFEAAPDDAMREAPRLRLDGRMTRGGGPDPYCTACGEPTGIFFGYGPDWHHFRAPVADPGAGPAGVYATDHTPVIGWRYTTPIARTDTTL